MNKVSVSTTSVPLVEKREVQTFSRLHQDGGRVEGIHRLHEGGVNGLRVRGTLNDLTEGVGGRRRFTSRTRRNLGGRCEP